MAERVLVDRINTAPDRYERILAIGALLMLAAVLVALARGYSEWARVPAPIWLHLATIITALVLTPIQLLRQRGDRLHRCLGWLWVIALAVTALISFDIRVIWAGKLSPIHLLSVWTLIQLPIIVWTARHHDIVRHRRAVRGMVTGALLIAGFFTFPFNRMLGQWLFG